MASSRPGSTSWDVAAGSLLVTEAGGLIGNFTGESDFLEQRECLAGAPKIYGQLVPLLAKYSKFASVDDKLRASDRIRAVDASLEAVTDGATQAEALDAAAPATRTLTRPRHNTPAPADPAER